MDAAYNAIEERKIKKMNHDGARTHAHTRTHTLSDETRCSTPPSRHSRSAQARTDSTAFGPARFAREVQNASTICKGGRRSPAPAPVGHPETKKKK